MIINQKLIRDNKTKRWLFRLLLLLFLVPLFQLSLPFVSEKPLEGVDPAPPFPAFSKQDWASEKYQKDYAAVLDQRIGFHASLVRLYNQLLYGLFRNSNVSGVIVGQDHYLYLPSYVNAYTGKDFRGIEYLRLQTEKISAVQRALKKKNIDLFVALAPGKASFYPEYIPKNLLVEMNADSTNYACYKALFKKHNINALDLREKFSALKTKEPYPLYLNTGVHWTDYGAYLGGKELVSYIETLRGTDLPDIQLDNIEMVALSGSKSSDCDAANLMNLYSTVPHSPVAIPFISFTGGPKKLNFLCISDSYFPGIEKTGIPRGVFRGYHYWLYNDQVFPESFLHQKRSGEESFQKQVERNDVICILCTDASLGLFPFGFIDKAYELYAPKDRAYRDIKNSEFRQKITGAIEGISKNKEWREDLISKAKAKGIPPADEFIANALWLYEQEQINWKNEN